MEPHRFALRTEWTGRPHTFDVEVWPHREALLTHLATVHPQQDWRRPNEAGETAAGAFVSPGGYMSNDAPELLGTIYWNEDHLGIGTIVHEIVHAAMLAYSCDLVGNYSLARVHIAETNETIAYLVDDLVQQAATQLLDLGLYDDVIVRDAAA